MFGHNILSSSLLFLSSEPVNRVGSGGNIKIVLHVTSRTIILTNVIVSNHHITLSLYLLYIEISHFVPEVYRKGCKIPILMHSPHFLFTKRIFILGQNGHRPRDPMVIFRCRVVNQRNRVTQLLDNMLVNS